MPFYDLKCRHCGHEFNIMAKMSEREQNTINCPECGSKEHDAVFNNVNIVHSRKSSEAPACPNAGICGGCCGR